MDKITARIEDCKKRGLWLIIEYDKNKDESTSWALTEEEILPIRDACNERLKLCNFELKLCKKCGMSNHLRGKCQKCKSLVKQD